MSLIQESTGARMVVEKLFEGDERMETLLQSVKEEIYKRGVGIPIPSIIGVLEIIKMEILKEQERN